MAVQQPSKICAAARVLGADRLTLGFAWSSGFASVSPDAGNNTGVYVLDIDGVFAGEVSPDEVTVDVTAEHVEQEVPTSPPFVTIASYRWISPPSSTEGYRLEIATGTANDLGDFVLTDRNFSVVVTRKN